MTTLEQTTNYHENQAMLKKFTNQFISQGFDPGDVESEVNWIFHKVCGAYKSDRNVKFSTYLYASLGRSLKKKFYKKPKYQHEELDSLLPDQNPSSEKKVIFTNTLENLSKEAIEIINTIFNSPAELVDMVLNETYSPRLTMRRLKRFMVNYKEWTHGQVDKTFNEVRKSLRSL